MIQLSFYNEKNVKFNNVFLTLIYSNLSTVMCKCFVHSMRMNITTKSEKMLMIIITKKNKTMIMSFNINEIALLQI